MTYRISSEGGRTWASVGVRLLLIGLAACISLVTLLALPSLSSADNNACINVGSRNVCLSIADKVDPVSPSGINPSYMAYDLTMTNSGPSTITHLTLKVPGVPAGGSFFSANARDSHPWVCTGSQCELSVNMPAGDSTTLRYAFIAPQTLGSVTAQFQLLVKERGNDGTETNDSIDLGEGTTVFGGAGEGSSFVLAGVGANVATDAGNATASDPQSLFTSISGASVLQDTSASLSELAPGEGPTFNCIDGKITLAGKTYVCRTGGWNEAIIPGTFDPMLLFRLRWDASLIPNGQSKNNFVVFHGFESGQIEVVSRLCVTKKGKPSPSNVACLLNPRKLADGDWTVDFYSPTNRYGR